MKEIELQEILASNIKLYRKGKFTQETLAEKIGVSPQSINSVEGKRRFPRLDILVKIANALNVEVYQLFIPENQNPVTIEQTPENELVRTVIQSEVIEDIRRILNKALDKAKK